MRALRFERFGDPLEVVFLQDIPQPEPAPDEVLIRYHYRSINPSDLATLQGWYGILPTLPATPGFEGMGSIVALGAEVKGYELGQKVIPLGAGAAWQEFGAVKAAQLLPIMPGISDQTAAQFLVNPVTAWAMLTEELPLEAGDYVLQTAAGSTLGRLIIQMSKLLNLKTINLVRRREQVQELLDLGGDVVLCTEEDDVHGEVMKLTGRGVKGAIDAVGGETGALAASCLRGGGKMLVYGLLSGQPIPLNAGEMLFKGSSIHGYWLAYWLRAKPREHIAGVMMKLMSLMAEGKLIPPVEAEYDLADFRQALQHAQTPGRSGKVLFTG